MGIIKVNDEERTSIIKRIIKFFDEIEVYIFLSPGEPEEDLKFMFTLGPKERILDLLQSLNDKTKRQAILATYKTSDIFCDHKLVSYFQT